MLRNYIHFSVRHIVFRNRYRSLSKNLLSTVRILIKRISCFIRNDLGQKFHHAKANNCIDDFKSKFLIDNVLGVIIDNSLTVKDLTQLFQSSPRHQKLSLLIILVFSAIHQIVNPFSEVRNRQYLDTPSLGINKSYLSCI